MTSDADKVHPGSGAGNAPEGWTIGGRATRDEIQAIDIACAIAGRKRGPWMIAVCVEEAKRIQEAHSRNVVADAA